MAEPITRRAFAAGTLLTLTTGGLLMADDKAPPATPPAAPTGPTEAPFERDYDAPKFKPGWKKPQINRTFAQDFVIYAHDNLDMVKKLLEKNPAVLNAAVDWGGGDWETALGGASHMGRRDIALFLLEAGARPDLFSAAMLGQLDVVKAWLKLQPKLIDSKGPHGFGLHWHANAGGTEAAAVLEFLQGLKKVELPKFPMKK